MGGSLARSAHAVQKPPLRHPTGYQRTWLPQVVDEKCAAVQKRFENDNQVCSFLPTGLRTPVRGKGPGPHHMPCRRTQLHAATACQNGGFQGVPRGFKLEGDQDKGHAYDRSVEMRRLPRQGQEARKHPHTSDRSPNSGPGPSPGAGPGRMSYPTLLPKALSPHPPCTAHQGLQHRSHVSRNL